MDSRPPVSVVVPFLGTDVELARLAARLERLDRRTDDELIVADNRSTDPGPGRIGEVLVHPAGGVRSPGFARNRGAARGAGEWLVFIDADTDPDPALLDGYFASPAGEAVGVLAGSIVDDPGPAPGIVARHLAARGQMSDAATLERAAFVYAQTANCAVRRGPFMAAGGFDEGIRAAEDADLCFRLAERGWRLEPRPGARVTHRTRATLGASLAQIARHGSGAAWCNRRHPGSFPPPSALGLAARLGRSGAQAAERYARGDREHAAFAALDIAEALAFELGRLLPNRSRR